MAAHKHIQKHICFFLVPAWGHVTSAHALINNMLHANQSLAITVVQHSMIFAKVKKDLAKYPDLPQDRLRVIPVGDPEVTLRNNPAEGMKAAFQEYQQGWLEMLSAAVSDGAAWPKPTALVLDQYGANLSLPAAKEIVGDGCKTLMHWTGCATCVFGFVAPSAHGGFSDFEQITDRIYNDADLRNGRERSEILEAVTVAKNGSDSVNGTIVHPPGVKAMYDYEREASNGPTPPVGPMLCEMSRLAMNTDGLIVASSETLEKEAIAACNQHVRTHAVGIQVAPRGWGKGLKIDDDGIRGFLQKQDANSVIYIAFGSIFFPTTAPGHVLILLETLLELKYPFLLALGGTMATNSVPADMVERIQKSGVGYVHNDWVDQQAILQHPSISWVLSHGGWNSISESLIQGLPLMIWPLVQADQAVNAANLSTRDYPVAFEFMQIRQGKAKAPALRGGAPIIGDDQSVKDEFTDVLKRTKGPEGANLRENAKNVGAQLLAERDSRSQAVITELAFI